MHRQSHTVNFVKKTWGCLVLACALSLAVSAFATNTNKPSIFPALSTTPYAELPAKAAELVAQADSNHVQQTTIEVVKSAVGLNPAAARLIVGCIAHSSPAMAATAAATAVALVPNQTDFIARAAAAAAPLQAGSIAEAICRVRPDDYQDVAEAIGEMAPKAGKEVWTGIANAIPRLHDSVHQLLTDYEGKTLLVDEGLNKIAATDRAYNRLLNR